MVSASRMWQPQIRNLKYNVQLVLRIPPPLRCASGYIDPHCPLAAQSETAHQTKAY